jgi:tetratricopeptide (TPR) repeat protein
MLNSTFIKPEVPEHLATSPHVISREFDIDVSSIYPYNRIHAPSSTLHSNVNDMINWALLNLNNGSYLSNQIVKPETYNLLTTPQHDAGGFGYVGLSWFISKYNGKTKVSHGGGDVGYCTEFIIIPEDSIAVVCLANYEYFDAEDITDIALSVIYGDEVKIYKGKTPVTFIIGKELTYGGIEAARKKYFDLYKNSKENYVFQEWCLSWLGYILLEQKRTEEAIDIFKFNVDLYPESADVYDCLAEAYMKNGNNEMAIKYYRITHEKDPEDEWCVKMLKKLGVDIANE